MTESSFKLEKELMAGGYDFVVGIDEAGRGPLAGPVVAAAATYKNGSLTSMMEVKLPQLKLIRDSKLLSEKQREELYDFICEHFYVGVGICDHQTIDRINILEATYLAMKKAVTDLFGKINNQDTRDKIQAKSKIQNPNLKQNVRNIILVDGNKIIPNLSMEQKAIVGGDKIVKSISAASIIAKVTRDRIMRQMHEKYPQYNFEKHKGYGTKTHMEMLEAHGPCEIHRRSFAPVKKCVKKVDFFAKKG